MWSAWRRKGVGGSMCYKGRGSYDPRVDFEAAERELYACSSGAAASCAPDVVRPSPRGGQHGADPDGEEGVYGAGEHSALMRRARAAGPSVGDGSDDRDVEDDEAKDGAGDTKQLRRLPPLDLLLGLALVRVGARAQWECDVFGLDAFLFAVGGCVVLGVGCDEVEGGAVDLAGIVAKLEVAHAGEEEGECGGAEAAGDLEHDSEVAREERDDHGGDDERGGEDDVAPALVLAAEEVGLEDLAADEALEGERGKHVEAEAEARDVDHRVGLRKVVEHVGECLVLERPVSCDGHGERCGGGDEGGVVGDDFELVHGRLLEAAVDEQRVVVAHECEADHRDGADDLGRVHEGELRERRQGRTRSAGLPVSSGGMAGPRTTTAKMMKTIERSATALALLRFSMLR